MKTIEGNAIIAEFMGAYQADPKHEAMDMDDKYPDGTDRAIPGRMKYHSSWGWLMPVVEKIEDMEDDDFRILGSSAEVLTYDGDIIVEMITKGTKLQAVYECAIAFIKWHNEQTPVMGSFDENGDTI